MTLKLTVVRKDTQKKVFEYICPEYRNKGNTFKAFAFDDAPENLKLSISNPFASIVLTGRTCDALVNTLVSNEHWYAYIKSLVEGIEEMKEVEGRVSDEHS